MIKRDTYIDKLKKFIGKPQVKIITGIRRSGKSTVLRLLMDELTQGGVKQNQIIYLNFESFANSHLTQAKSLYEHVKGIINGTEKYYLLFDEIQEVENWERAINSFLVDFNSDIYLTGSNSHLLSSELSTFLAGRYVEIPMRKGFTYSRMFYGYSMWPLKINYKHMKSPFLPCPFQNFWISKDPIQKWAQIRLHFL